MIYKTKLRLLPIQIKMVSEGKLGYCQPEKISPMHGKLFDFWALYELKTIAVNQLLKRCGSIYESGVLRWWLILCYSYSTDKSMVREMTVHLK